MVHHSLQRKYVQKGCEYAVWQPVHIVAEERMVGIDMGRIFSSLMKRPLRNFNVDNRAQRVIESDKIRPAPRYRQDLPLQEGNILDMKKKPTDLLERLKSVKVISEDPDIEIQDKEQQQTKHLPQNRSFEEMPEYGYHEADIIPEGKIALRKAVEFLNHHQMDPKVWNAELIAKEYKLDKIMTEQILKYFSLYNVTFPDKQESSRLISLDRFKNYLSAKKAIGDNKLDTQPEKSQN